MRNAFQAKDFHFIVKIKTPSGIEYNILQEAIAKNSHLKVEIKSGRSSEIFNQTDLSICLGICSMGRELLACNIPTIYYDVLNLNKKNSGTIKI